MTREEYRIAILLGDESMPPEEKVDSIIALFSRPSKADELRLIEAACRYVKHRLGNEKDADALYEAWKAGDL